METEKAIRTRRTHKAFSATPVPRTVLDELFELASWAPNHHLTNPWRFRVLGPSTRAALMDLAESETVGAAAKLARAPTLVFVTAAIGGEDPAQDREDLLASGVAAYLVLLAAHARGLAGYWRTVPLLADPRARSILGAPASEEPVGLIYLGEPVQEQRIPERAPVDEFVEYLP